jgi:hypothetical protein
VRISSCHFKKFVLLIFFFRVPATNSQGTGIHWQVSQATSLMNIVVQMSTASNTAHQGKVSTTQIRTRTHMLLELPRYLDGKWKVYDPTHRCENLTSFLLPSGGFMGDLVFNGGKQSLIHVLLLILKNVMLFVLNLGKYGIWGGNQQ